MNAKNMNRFTAAFLALVLAGVTAAHAGTITNFYDNFDSTAVGQPPSTWNNGGGPTGWYTYNNGGLLLPYVYVTNNVSVSAPHSLFVKGETGYGVFAYLDPQIPETTNVTVSLQFDINLSQANAISEVRILDQVINTLLALRFDNAGNIMAVTSGGGSVSLAPYTSNKWYHVDMDLHPSLSLYDVSITANGAPYVSGTNYSFVVNNTGWKMSMVDLYNGTSGSSFNVDNLFVSIPEPSIACLGAAGLLAVVLNWRSCRSASRTETVKKGFREKVTQGGTKQ